MIERISFEVHDILAGENRAVILGSLASRLKHTGRTINTDFAIVLTAADGEIVSSDAPKTDLDFQPSKGL
jgi:ketosteroid isomerase-like protein